MDKQSTYVQAVIALHNLRDKTKETVSSLQEKSLANRLHNAWNKTQAFVSNAPRRFFSHPEDVPCEHIPQKYGYIFRRKSLWELTLISATVCGIEFCYAAETAFVTPVLLSLGLSMKFVTMFWCLSPLLAFIFTSVLGSLSDSCQSRFGRRRPFITALSIGILIGLFLVPYGRQIGYALGDEPFSTAIIEQNASKSDSDVLPRELNLKHPVTPKKDINVGFHEEYSNRTYKLLHGTTPEPVVYNSSSRTLMFNENLNRTLKSLSVPDISSLGQPFDPQRNETFKKDTTTEDISRSHLQIWSIVFTVLGTILIDFCADVCQSPCRAYLLDISVPEEHAKGLSTFSFMAGLGAALGYMIGAIRWDVQVWGNVLEGQVIVVFSIITVIFILCLITSLCNFPEIPLTILRNPAPFKEYQEKRKAGSFQNGMETIILEKKQTEYSSTSQKDESGKFNDEEKAIHANGENAKGDIIGKGYLVHEKADVNIVEGGVSVEHTTLKEYLKSVIHMPKSLRILCLTNLFCWMSVICYCLYFTDYVGESVYNGDPTAPENSEEYVRYKEGVRFGCWGMSFASFSCCFYSIFVEDLVKHFGAKPIYISGGVIYSIGMVIMALFKHPVVVIILSSTAGVMFTTVFTMPYLLISGYHTRNKFRNDGKKKNDGVRGIGTDVAAVTSMLVLSQLILSLSTGSIVEAVGSNVVTVYAAALFSACGAVSATQVMYLDM